MDSSSFNSWEDEEQIEMLNVNLPSELKYQGEFGPEIVTFVPFIFNLKKHGLLKNRSVTTYAGMQPYYYFLKRGELKQISETRSYIPHDDRWWPNSNEHHRLITQGETFPVFQKEHSTNKRPLVFIQNKYCVEWDREPINFLDLDTLNEIFKITKNRFDVIYSRQGSARDQSKLGIAIDHNKEIQFNDLDLCGKFNHVRVLERIRSFRSYNSNKLKFINQANLLVGVQGGSNSPWAYFNKNAVILHREGRETEHSYENGFYKYLSPIPLKLEVVSESNELLIALKNNLGIGSRHWND